MDPEMKLDKKQNAFGCSKHRCIREVYCISINASNRRIIILTEADMSTFWDPWITRQVNTTSAIRCTLKNTSKLRMRTRFVAVRNMLSIAAAIIQPVMPDIVRICRVSCESLPGGKKP